MATSFRRSIVCCWGLLAVVGWFVPIANGEPNPICKTLPAMDKGNHDKGCCDVPQVFNNQSLHECFGSIPEGPPSPQSGCELAQCIMKKHGFVKSDGRLDADQIRAYIKDTIKASSEMKRLMESIVLEECGPMIEAERANIEKLLKPAIGQCSDPIPAMLITCAGGKLHTKCPTESYTDSKLCNDFKSYFSTCTGSVDDVREMFMAFQMHTLPAGNP
ncbi:general odorant-binding protein 68-like [Anopheles bellator]|uniref:general odorant-binding protein 68-like n=1 Tax=Anopheles bellator TaxID=139047 RepID=UPI00264988B5|nr:general odorant-binding protein 68-like [Anopheles bellator]